MYFHLFGIYKFTHKKPPYMPCNEPRVLANKSAKASVALRHLLTSPTQQCSMFYVKSVSLTSRTVDFYTTTNKLP